MGIKGGGKHVSQKYTIYQMWFQLKMKFLESLTVGNGGTQIMCMRNIQSKNGGINNQVPKKGNKFQMISVTIYISTD